MNEHHLKSLIRPFINAPENKLKFSTIHSIFRIDMNVAVEEFLLRNKIQKSGASS